MYQTRKLRLIASILLCFLLQAQGADKYTDENRPYEFGFKIDGQQHRHESKDKDGIIMGEFGFITADDVYHVTVYATDKEGRFKILSMKNIHLKSSPASSAGPPTSGRQGHALALPPAQAASVQVSAVPQGAPAPQPGNPSKSIIIEKPGRSCSSCSLPTTTTRAPPPAYNQVNGNSDYNNPNQFGVPGSSPQSFPPSSSGQQNNAQGGGSPYGTQGGQQNYPQQGPAFPQNNPQQGPAVSQNYPQQGSGVPNGEQSFPQQPGQAAQNYPGSPSYAQGPSSANIPNNYAQPGPFSSGGQNQGAAGQQPGAPQAYPGEQNSLTGGDSGPYAGAGPRGQAGLGGGLSGPNAQYPGDNSYPQGAPGGRASKQYNGPEQQLDSNVGPNGSQGPGSVSGGQHGPIKPTLVSAQMQIVDKNTDIHALRPGETQGLPPGLTKDDMTQLLYTFNYTVGFHGHFEEGYTNGVKKGYYYVTGRNGVRTKIDYVADDTGFHPKVSQDVLDLLSDDVPKAETEKDAKFGLKGYEFKWLYYPVDSKRR